MAALNGNRVTVSVIGGISHFVNGNALYDLAFKPDHKMAADRLDVRLISGLILQPLKKVPVFPYLQHHEKRTYQWTTIPFTSVNGFCGLEYGLGVR